jgi:hypothetical protein
MAPSGSDVGSMDDEERRYQEARAKAETDPAVQELKKKSDSALSWDEGREASLAYTHALFGRIREIDGTLAERADLVENAVLKRIGE